MNNNQNKSRLIAGLLGIFLGSYGVHNFYLGYTRKAIIQVSLSVGSLILAIFLYMLAAILSVIVIGIFIFPIAFLINMIPVGIWVWGLVEGIMIFSGNINKDANGNPLVD